MKTHRFDLYKESLKDIGYEDAMAVKAWLNDKTSFGGSLWNEYQEDLAEKRRQSEIRSKEEAKKKSNLLPKIERWLDNNARVGMRFKMKGCKDGSGIRELLTVDFKNRGTHDQLTLECRQVFPENRRWQGVGRVFKTIPERLGQVTQHMSDKVVNVQINGLWIPVKNLV